MQAADTKDQAEGVETHKVDEVQVKSLQREVTDIRGKQGLDQQTGAQRAKILEVMNANRSAVGAMATMHLSAPFVKPAADIMKPLVIGILQESPELAQQVEQRKDAVAAFVEFCRDMVPEELSVRVFETLANRAQLLVDTLIKSPSEFWKVWSLLFPALVDFSESSPVFESIVFLFKRLGDLMRDADPSLTQQLMTEVGLPSLAKELASSPEKREALCEIIYSYTQEETLSHLLVLRALKERLNDLPVYISCLSCLVSHDARLGVLDEHLLDLYIYYALMALQNLQPRIRVAGLAIFASIAGSSEQQSSVLAVLPSLEALVTDDWWEVQAQLLLLSSQLLTKLVGRAPKNGKATLSIQTDEDATSAVDGEIQETPRPDPVTEAPRSADDPVVQTLLSIVQRIFVVGNSKHVLQVGLSALVHLLEDFPMLPHIYVTALLGQPPALRQRLFQGDQTPDPGRVERRTYVMGTSSRMYEECCVSSLWPHLDVAKAFAVQVEAAQLDHFELEHVEVLLACLPPHFEDVTADEWLEVFGRVKQYAFVALVDQHLHEYR